MDLPSFRKSRGLSQEECARELGLRSKGYLSSLESGQERMPLRLALQIEAWSAGEVTAASLLTDDDAKLLAGHRRLASAHPAEVAA